MPVSPLRWDDVGWGVNLLFDNRPFDVFPGSRSPPGFTSRPIVAPYAESLGALRNRTWLCCKALSQPLR